MQNDNTMDLQIHVQDLTLSLRERPYIDKEQLDVDVDRIHVSMHNHILKGRHTNHADLEMKMT